MPTQFPATIELSDLNGQNGFKLNGVTANSNSGVSVSQVGDIDGDGIADLIIGAYGADPNGSGSGQSYVVFGGACVGATGTFELSSLNGANGFKLNGITTNDYSGTSVSGLGDINDDGVDDLIIGAFASPNGSKSGQSYVVFGGVGVGSGGTIELSNLNGSNGFKINGIAEYDYSGCSVSQAGDVNADSIGDFIIGAYGAAPNGGNSGQSYVVFGSAGVGSRGTLELSALNGTNGFKLNGIAAGDFSGRSVSQLGDINADGVGDLIIGAYGADPNGSYSGQSYVVFGGVTVGSVGTIELSSLNGVNGFILNGIIGDWSGRSVSQAGDINGDGVGDLIIGAPEASPHERHTGQTYVVFGGTSVGSTGIVELSNLNGANGFKLNGFVSRASSGFSVNQAGDISGDGIADLIIGAYADLNNPDSGQSYVVFGAACLGASGTLELSSLDGKNGFKLNSQEKEMGDRGFLVSTAGDINNDGIDDVIIGTTGGGLFNVYTGQSYVVFGDDIELALSDNQLTIDQGQTVIFNQYNLNVTSNSNFREELQFIISNIQHGQFEFVSNPSIPITNFCQQDVIKNRVQFVQDWSTYPPLYDVSVFTGRWITTTPQVATIHFEICSVNIEKNQLSINQGAKVVLGKNNLYATSYHCPPGSLQFVISDIKHGQFEFISNPSEAITTFDQQNIIESQVQFVQDWSIHPPAYNISASTGKSISTVPNEADINFGPLVLVNNALTVNQGRTHILNSEDLYAKDNDAPASQITFTINDLQYGHFVEVSTPSMSIDHFTQQQINNNQIKFTQDGTPNVPSYSVTVTDGTYTLPPSAANITFNSLPVLEVNNLSIEQGQTVLLTKNNLKATFKNQETPELIFIVSAINNGWFEFVSQPKVPIAEFTQGQVDIVTVQFVQDGTPNVPSYNVSVKSNALGPATDPQAALINWRLAPSPSKAHLKPTTRNALIGTLVSGGFLGILLMSYVSVGLLKNRRLNATAKEKKGEQKQFYQEVIIPIAKAIFKQVKVTGFMNYISTEQAEAYVAAIATVVNGIQRLGIDIEIQHMAPEQSTELLIQITEQIKHHLNIEKSKCNRAWFTSFFKPRVTPKMISEKAQVIAESVHDALLGKNEAGVINLPANVDLMDVVGQVPTDGEFTTGYVQMP